MGFWPSERVLELGERARALVVEHVLPAGCESVGALDAASAPLAAAVEGRS